MAHEYVYFGVVFVVLLLGILSSRAAYNNGVNDGYGYSQEPTNPGYQKAGRWLYRYARWRWDVPNPDGVDMYETNKLLKAIGDKAEARREEPNEQGPPP